MKKATIFILSLLCLGITQSSFAQLTLKKKTQVEIPDIPEFIKVEGGTFIMGSDFVHSSERPKHEVSLKSYNISKYPVTVKQYRKFCNATGYSMPEAPKWGWQDNYPIMKVSYNDAVAYCKWLNQEYEANFRLPTEAEWEYAARGGNKSKNYKYSGSDNLETVGWFAFNSNEQTQAVGQKKPNELGIYDMSGNVWEWCSDWFGDDYYSNSPRDDPKGPASGFFCVQRGGSYYSTAQLCNVVYRGLSGPDIDDFDYGFRVVRSE